MERNMHIGVVLLLVGIVLSLYPFLAYIGLVRTSVASTCFVVVLSGLIIFGMAIYILSGYSTRLNVTIGAPLVLVSFLVAFLSFSFGIGTGAMGLLIFMMGVVAYLSSIPMMGRSMWIVGKVYGSVVYWFGKSVRNVSVAMFIYWLALKIGVVGCYEDIFISVDTILAAVLFLYVIGSVIIEIAWSSIEKSPSQVIRSVISSGFFSMLFIGILSYIFMAIDVVGSGWSSIHSFIWRTVGLLFIGLILAIIIVKPEPRMPIYITGNIEPTDEAYVFSRTRSIFPSSNIEIVVRNGSYLIPLHRNGEVCGAYICGEIQYSAEIEDFRVKGEADRMAIISMERENRIMDEVLNHGYVDRVVGDSLYVREMRNEARDMVSEYSQSHLSGIKDVVRMPFIHVVSNGAREFVRVGPIITVDTEDMSYVSIGPMKVMSKRRRKKEVAPNVLFIRDIEKGLIAINYSDEAIKITWDDIEIWVSPDKTYVRRGKISYLRTLNFSRIYWRHTKITLYEDKAKIIVDGEIYKVDRERITRIYGSRKDGLVGKYIEGVLDFIEEKILEASKQIIRGMADRIILEIIDRLRNLPWSETL